MRRGVRVAGTDVSAALGEVVCSRGSPYRASAVQSREYLAHDFLVRLDKKEDGDQSRATAMSDREMIAFCPPNNRECC